MQHLTEIILSSIQDTVEICKQITLFIFYQFNSRMVNTS
jgi:hypothetical protein